MSNVKVQVICVTYNQKDFIRDALDSFLMQKTNFKFEVLVGDDSSTDGTGEIVAEYAKKYPDIIKYIKRETNMGCLANFMDLCERADAKYVSFCDGDDYWTNENKLQRQFDFMEENRQYNVCSHLTKVEADSSDASYNWFKSINFLLPRGLKTEIPLSINDIAVSTPHSSSLFIRWHKVEYPIWAKTNGTMGDFVVTYLHLGNKYCYMFDEIMSCYRRLGGGVSTNKMSLEEHFVKTRPEYIKIYYNMSKYFKDNFNAYGVEALENRLKAEIRNYLNALQSTRKGYLLPILKEQYPELIPMIDYLMKKYKIKKRTLLHKILETTFSVRNLNNTHKCITILGIKIKIRYEKKTRNKTASNMPRDVILMQHLKLYHKAASLHSKVFPKYKNKYNNKAVALIGCGPTLNYFNGVSDLIYVGVNHAFKYDKLVLDYFFVADWARNGRVNILESENYKNPNLKRFYAIHEAGKVPMEYIIPESVALRHNAERFYIRTRWTKNVLVKDEEYAYDLSCEPLTCSRSIVFPALQFILYTNPKKLYIVGCDCSANGHFDDNNFIFEDPSWLDAINGWKLLKKFAEVYYPETEIISINPIGLKGLFRDVYTEGFLAEHPEIDRKLVEIINDKGEIR